MATALNEDVYADLLTFISSPADLLAMALTSSDLFRLVMPELRYRSIRTHLGNNALWMYLVENPTLSLRVRELVILKDNAHSLLVKKEMERLLIPDLRSAVPPRRITKADAEQSERLLVQALRVLVNLESFGWHREAPLINDRQEVPLSIGLPEVYSEDVWTALRNHTQVKKLIVMNIGRRQMIVPASTWSVFNSSMYTLRNLTHVELKLCYTPAEDNGSAPKINTDRLQAFLHSCSDLEFLSLEIFDRRFHAGHGRRLFTDISPILIGITWPRLTCLQLGDVVVNKQVITLFLNRHPTLRTIAADLSLSVNERAQNFELDMKGLKKDALPNLTHLAVHPKMARPILCGVPDHSTIRELAAVEPRVWDAPEVEIESPMACFDTWSELPLENTYEDEDDNTRLERAFRLKETKHLKSLSLWNVTELEQLEALAKLTPNLESLSIHRCLIKSVYSNPAPHTSWLPFLANWPCLTTIKGIYLWPPTKGLEMTPELAREILKACPNMKEMKEMMDMPWTYHNGEVVKFKEGGKYVIEVQV